MKKTLSLSAIGLSLLIAGTVLLAQHTPWMIWTLLPQAQMDEIIGEASGETAFNTIMETGGYNKDRQTEEYAGTFYESQYIYDQLKLYGLPGTDFARFPGRTVWDGIKGEVWEIKPRRQKLASYQDMTAMLASGSSTADVKAELVWVGRGTAKEMKDMELAGKIVVTEGSASNVHSLACIKMGAAGVIGISTSREHFDPLQIPWRGISSRGGQDTPSKFAFYLPAREGAILKQRLLRNEKILVHAQVESTQEPYDLQNVVCHIPGTDPTAGEVILSAHLFEGYVKQGANDNKSGSAGILEVARVLHTLIEEGRLPRPKRTIRFLWGPEFSGTGPWVKANKDLMDKTLCNINMDMVGEWLSLNKAFLCLMRTSYGNPHYINDVMENCYRYVGEGSRERIQNRSGPEGVMRRIVAPSGADEPFYYSIETHYGASDHEVFNDWGVQVPGIMMIVWPDQWYHTSGDRVDKSDPTQLKRVAAIGAAGAYTVANANDDMAIKIASETASNGARRLGHQMVRGLEALNQAAAVDLAEAYKTARMYIEAAALNEAATLDTVMELAADTKRVGTHVVALKKSVESLSAAHLSALDAHMRQRAAFWRVEPIKVEWSELEQKAAKIVPRPTAKITANGYRGYSEFIDAVPDEKKKEFPYDRRSLGNTRELNLLINGKNSVLDIQHLLDAQAESKSDLKAVFNYLEILKLAGLIEF
jgi:hypothetical protein